MRVLITGGTGKVGKPVVERLLKLGFWLRIIGRSPGPAWEGAEYHVCDVTDFARLREMVRGCEAVVHLAAIPNPEGRPEEVVHANAQGTFNVFQAAAEEGIRRVVQASSINAAGQFYGAKPAPLEYLPLDEDHPTFTTDAYSFSKGIVEEVGGYFWRREGIASLAFRLPWVAPIEHHEKIGKARARIYRLVEKLESRSLAERRAWFEKAWARYNAFRATRPYETHGLVRQTMDQLSPEEQDMFWAMSQRVNFFTMMDERDAAQAVEKALTAPFSGSHVVYITDRCNWTGIPSRTLAQLFYPDVPAIKPELTGTSSLVSIEHARQLIGFEPEFSFGMGR